MDFEECKNEFNKYVSNFDMNINKINRKYYHTYRVVGYKLPNFKHLMIINLLIMVMLLVKF